MNRSFPLALPPGSVRAVIALGTVGVFCAGFLTGRINAEQFVPVVSAVMISYGFVRQGGADPQVPPTPPAATAVPPPPTPDLLPPPEGRRGRS